MDREYYIANCIQRIIAAPCHPNKARWRALDMAAAVRIAHLQGIIASHNEFQRLLELAERGHYKKRQKKSSV